jgi:hypothetical protein
MEEIEIKEISIGTPSVTSVAFVPSVSDAYFQSSA